MIKKIILWIIGLPTLYFGYMTASYYLSIPRLITVRLGQDREILEIKPFNLEHRIRYVNYYKGLYQENEKAVKEMESKNTNEDFNKTFLTQTRVYRDWYKSIYSYFDFSVFLSENSISNVGEFRWRNFNIEQLLSAKNKIELNKESVESFENNFTKLKTDVLIPKNYQNSSPSQLRKDKMNWEMVSQSVSGYYKDNVKKYYNVIIDEIITKEREKNES